MYVSWIYTAVIKISKKRKMKEEILILVPSVGSRGLK